MGVRTTRSLGRGLSRTLLLLLVALVAAVAVPGGQAGAAKKTPPGDPPGNNGTIKVDRTDPKEPQDLGNEPHGEGCEIWLEFYGFDAGQHANIKFELQAPSKPKEGSDGVLATFDNAPISGDAAGGGPNDPEDSDEGAILYSFKLTKALEGVEVHQHGYHIKVSVDVIEAPGDSKKKVFWMGACPEAQTPPASAAASTLRISKEQVGTGQGPFTFDLNCDHSPLNRTFTLNAGEKLDIADVPVGTTCKVTETDKKGAEATITEDPPTGAAGDGEVKTTAEKSTIVKVSNKFPTGDQVVAAPPDNDIRPPAGTPAGNSGNPGAAVGGTNTATNPGASVLGGSQTAPDATLPRTGNDPLPLTATGLSALAAGAALLAGSRRRRG